MIDDNQEKWRHKNVLESVKYLEWTGLQNVNMICLYSYYTSGLWFSATLLLLFKHYISTIIISIIYSSNPVTTQQIIDIAPVLVQCWPAV